MTFDKNGVKVVDSVVLADHLIDDLTDFQCRLLITRLDLVSAGIETKQFIGNAQHRMVFTDLYLDAPLPQFFDCLIENLLPYRFGLLQLFDLLIEVSALLHQLQNKNNRGEDKKHQKRRHDIHEGLPVRILILHRHVMGFTPAHQRASSSSTTLLIACTAACI
ncbi:hypothetical protein D3C81_1509220 [compost metagenome]